MSEVWFYHLTHEPLERALPRLLCAAREKAGWRVKIRGGDPNVLAWLDEKLWLLEDDSFLPHAMEGGVFDALQPILLGTAAGSANAAECLMLIAGAGYEASDLDRHERVCLMFDGNDETALELAREQWRFAKAAGHVAKYQSQENGRWELRAQTGG